MLSYLFRNGYYSCAAFLGVAVLISTFAIVFTNKSLFDISKQDQSIFNDDTVDFCEDGEITEESPLYVPLMQWRAEYNHPLMLSSDKAKQGSAQGAGELKNINNMEELKND